MCHECFPNADDVSWAGDWRTLCPIARPGGRLVPLCHWHFTLVCVAWYCREMNGSVEEDYSVVLHCRHADHQHSRHSQLFYSSDLVNLQLTRLHQPLSFSCMLTSVTVSVGVDGTRLTSQAAYHSGGVGRGRSAQHRTCYDQLLSLLQYTRTFRTAVSRLTLLIVSAIWLERRYGRGVNLYADRLVLVYVQYVVIREAT